MLSLNFSMMGSVPPLNRPPAPKSPPRAPAGAVLAKRAMNKSAKHVVAFNVEDDR